MPNGFAGLESTFDPFGIYNVGGGADEAERLLNVFRAVELARAARKSTGLGLLGTLIETQRDPFSIVPALQAYSAAGGGVQAPINAFAATGGAGAPSPYGSLVDRLLGDLSTFALSQQQQQAAPPIPLAAPVTPSGGSAATSGFSNLGLPKISNRIRNARRTVSGFLGGR